MPLRYRANLKQKVSGSPDFGAYDYGSIMHYPVNAFTSDHSASLIPLKFTTSEIGQRKGLSTRDIATVHHVHGVK